MAAADRRCGLSQSSLPLTIAQRRLWLERLVDPSRAGDLLTATWEMERAIDEQKLSDAITSVSRRHDALRVHLDPSDPVQALGESRLQWAIEGNRVSLIAPPECCDARSFALLRHEIAEQCAGRLLQEPGRYAEAVLADQGLGLAAASVPRWRPPTRIAPELISDDADSVAVEKRSLATPFDASAHLATFEALVRCYAGGEEVVAGLWIEAMKPAAVGCFTSVVPLITIDESRLLAAIPFDRLLETLRPERVAGRHPLFEMTLAFGAAVVPSRARFDLELTAGDELCLVYRSAFWPREWARQFLDHYVQLLTRAAIEPYTPAVARDEILAAIANPGAMQIRPSAALARIARALKPIPQSDGWTIFSGEPLTDSLVQSWRRVFPGRGRILNVYEDACAYEVPQPPMRGTQPVGTPLPGADVRLINGDGNVCGLGELGELLLRGQRTGDLGRFRSDGTLELLGRNDRLVTTGGTRVDLDQVERSIAQLPGVLRVSVTAEQGLDGERRVVAHVTPSPDTTLRTSEITSALTQRVSIFIETGATIAPRDPIELQLARIWEELLQIDGVGVTDDFFALGGDSLLAVQLLARVSRDLGHWLDPAALLPDATIEHLAHLVRHGDRASATSLITIQRGTSGPTLFCVHPSGGSILCYVDLARLMGPARRVCGLKGADPRDAEHPPQDASSMAEQYVSAVRAAQSQGPYCLAGYSFGGLIAFEMARQLGDEVTFLALFDTRYPREYGPEDRNPVIDLAGVLERHDLDREVVEEREEHELWRELMELAGRYLPADGRQRRRGFSAIQEFCRTYRLMPSADDLGYRDLRRFLRNLRSNFRTMRDYRPAPARARPILFAARHTMDGRASDYERNAALWRSVAPAMEVRTLDANHFNLLAPPSVDVLAAALMELLP